MSASKEKVTVGTESPESARSVQFDEEDGSGEVNPFSDPVVADYWRKVYENAQYEGRHRFDPDFTWTAEEETRVKRKVDWRIMTWCWVMFLALDLNRQNIARAISDDMLEELGMDTNDYNTGQTILLVSFLAAEIPSGLVSKRLGADIWIPFLITSWSVVSAFQAALQNKAGYYVCRCLLGLLMGGFIPDTVLYITYWYTSKELPRRLSWFWTVLNFCQIVGSLVASGVLQMRGVAGWTGWQWLFVIEGAISFIIGIASYFLMPASVCQTSGRGRGKGWFNEREEKILVNRLLRNDPSKGDMHNRQAVNWEGFVKCIKDYDLWPLYLIGLTNYIPAQPSKGYLTYILRQMGFSTLKANLLFIPSQVVSAANLLIMSWVSERINERALISSLSNIWILPWLAVLVGLGSSIGDWTRYAVTTVLLSYPYCHAILVAWNSRNSNSVRTRAVSAAMYNMFVQAGNIVGTNIYRESDRPYYITGNKVLLGICCFNIVLLPAVKYFYIRRNARREEAWAKLTGEERVQYVTHTTDEGAKRLDFRFAH